MARPVVKNYEERYLNAMVFFLTDEQNVIVEKAIDYIKFPHCSFSYAQRRAIVLTMICAQFLHDNAVSEARKPPPEAVQKWLNKEKCLASAQHTNTEFRVENPMRVEVAAASTTPGSNENNQQQQ
jgi:hypothetical protein